MSTTKRIKTIDPVFSGSGGSKMTYRNDFVLAIKHNGKVLRESSGIVYLPFNSEYSVLLKNNRNRTAIAKVFIDGMDISNEMEYVIHANGSLELERFCLDGSLTTGKKFKFVKSDHPDTVDPTSPENGKVRVTFWEEDWPQPVEYYNWYTYPPYYVPRQFPGYWDNYYTTCGGGGKQSANVIRSINTPSTSYSNTSSSYTYSSSESGATVEGSVSDQKFHTVSTHGKNYSTETTLELHIRPSQSPITVETTRYIFCSRCGNKIKRSWTVKYCSKCGQHL